MNKPENTRTCKPAGVLSRLLAMFYDSLLLFSVLLIATAMALIMTRGTLQYHNPFFRTGLFLICFSFYSWFWLHGGQTLGMRAWHLRVQHIDGQPITIWQALLRFLIAIPALAFAGLGFFWMLVDRDKMTLYDRFSESVIVRLPKDQ
jgi:uncharacterized RDD family membrane protein YckC